MGFRPYADGASTTTIDDLTIEDQGDRLSIYGNMDAAADRTGLAALRGLKEIIDAAIVELEGRDLPESIETLAPTEGDNPFGGDGDGDLPGASKGRPF